MRKLIAATAAALVLTSCGEPAVKPKPVETPTASASPTTPAAPEMPAAAKEKTKAGAEAFVRHFLVVMDSAGESGDTKPLRNLFQKGCGGCAGIAEIIEGIHQQGGTIEGGAWNITKTFTYAFEPSAVPIDALVDYESQTVVQKTGATPVRTAASQGNRHYFEVGWTSDGWRMTGLDEKPQ